MATQVVVPALGESITQAVLIKWHKHDGQHVDKNEPLCELETEKANADVPAPASGIVHRSAAEGQTLKVGQELASIEPAGQGQAAEPSQGSDQGQASGQGQTSNQSQISSQGQAPAQAHAAGQADKPKDHGLNDQRAKKPADESAVAAAQKAAKPASPAATSKHAPSASESEPSPTTGQPPSSPAAAARMPEAQHEDLSPAVRRMVKEEHLDPAAIAHKGPGKRLTKQDVVEYLENMPPSGDGQPPGAPASTAAASASDSSDAATVAATRADASSSAAAMADASTSAAVPASAAATAENQPAAAPAQAGERREPLSKLRQKIAQRLVAAQHTAAILTTFNEIDLTEMMSLRSRYKERFNELHGVGLGLMSFFVRGVVQALREFPRLNAFIDGPDVVYHDHVHLGVAVSTPRGLVVPVLKNVQTMSFARIEQEIKRLATAARDGKLALDELGGGTFSITNGGVFGSLLSTPILNPPQSGILGMHTIQKRPMVIDDNIVARQMMYVALSYDHRLVDGQESVRFLVRIKQLLEDPSRLLLEV